MTLLLALQLVESALAAVAASALFVGIYNRFLSGLRESHLKKFFSLSTLPAGMLAGLFHFAAIRLELPRFWPIAFVGLAVILWRGKHLLWQWRLNRPWRTEAVPMRERGINWAEIPVPARLVLRLIAPVNQVDSLQIVRRRLALPGLHPDMDGFRIVFLTDFHVHKWMRAEWFHEVVGHALALRPDAVILGGDFVSRRRFAEAAAEALAGLAGAPDLLAVRGNHDFWTRPGFFGEMVQSWGGIVLSNEVAVLRRGEGAVAVVGLEAPYLPLTSRATDALEKELSSLDLPRIGIVHTPQAYPLAAQLRCALTLAGHTHGGQVRLPFFGTTICSCTGRPEDLWGAGRTGSMATFTSNGIGAFYPLRVACPPQIVEVTLAVRKPRVR